MDLVGPRGLSDRGRCYGPDMGLNGNRHDEVGEQRAKVGSSDLIIGGPKIQRSLSPSLSGSIMTKRREVKPESEPDEGRPQGKDADTRFNGHFREPVRGQEAHNPANDTERERPPPGPWRWLRGKPFGLPVKDLRRELFSALKSGLPAPARDREGALAHCGVPRDQPLHGLCPTGGCRSIALLTDELRLYDRPRICMGKSRNQSGTFGVQSAEELLPVFQGGLPVWRKPSRIQRIAERGRTVPPVHLGESLAYLPVQAVILLPLGIPNRSPRH